MKRTILALLIFTVALFGIGYSSLAQQNSGGVVLDIVCAGKGAVGDEETVEDEIIVQKEGYTYELNQGQRHLSPKYKTWNAMGEDLIFTLKGLKTKDKYLLLLDSPVLTAYKVAANVYINDALVLEDWMGVKTPLLLKSEWYARGEVKVVLEPKGPGVAIQNIKLFSAENEEAIKKILSQLKEVKEEVEEKPKEEIMKITSKEFTSTIQYKETICYKEVEGELFQVILLEVNNPQDRVQIKARIKINGSEYSQSLILESGKNFKEIEIPAVDKATEVEIALLLDSQVLDSRKIKIKPQKRYEIYIAPGTHADYGWVAPSPRINELFIEYMNGILEIMDSNPDFKWIWESVFAVKNYLDKYPQNKDKIIKYLGEGRMEIASGWVLPTGMTFDGESLVRQVIHSKYWLKENLDYEPRIIQQYDVGDHTLQFPQILSKSGVKSYIWNLSLKPLRGKEGYPLSVYNWLAPDSSKVLSIKTAGYSKGFDVLSGVLGEEVYSIRADAWLGKYGEKAEEILFKGTMKEALNRYIEMQKQKASNQSIIANLTSFVHHQEDRGAVFANTVFLPAEADVFPPTTLIAKIVRNWNKRYFSPKLVLSTPSDYLSQLEKKKILIKDSYQGQITPSPTTHLGHIGSTIRWEAQNKLLYKILSAEKFATLNYLVNGVNYPIDKIDKAWENLLYTQDHNYGLNPQATLELTLEEWKHKEGLIRQAYLISDKVLKESVHQLASNIKFQEKGIPLVVFNPLAHQRTEVVEIPLPTLNIKDLIVEDNEGKVVSYQTNEKEKTVTFQAKVPSFGYATYYLKEGADKREFSGEIKWSDDFIENEFYRIVIDSQTGFIKSLFDKELNKELLNTQTDLGGQIRVAQRGKLREFETLKAKIKIKGGPVMAKVVISGEGIIPLKPQALSIDWKQQIALYKGLKKVDITNFVDWDYHGVAPVLTDILVHFPFNLSTPAINYEVAYGDMKTEKISDKIPLQKWISLHDSSTDIGIDVATDWGRWQSRGANLISTSKIFSVSHPNHYSLWQGGIPSNIHRYTISSHRGNWRQSKAYQSGWENLNRLIPVVMNEAEGTNGKLPEVQSFLTIEPENVIMSVFKLAYDEDGVIVRVYEASGRGAQMKMRFFKAFKELWQTNMIEDREGQLDINKINIDASEIKTLKFLFKKD